MNAPSRPAGGEGRLKTLSLPAPGLFLALTVAAAASFVAEATGGPVMLFALLIGIALNAVAADARAGPGLALAARPVLQLGIALLGLRISAAQVADLGADTLLLVAAGVALSIASGVLLSRLLGLPRAFGILAGGATGICGASAALALSSALPASRERDRDTAFVIVAVTTLSTAAMIAYPLLARLAGFDGRAAGIFLGATIHDVAQVVGAGYAFSVEAGDTATIVKLFRVALLLPAVLVVALARRRRAPAAARLPRPLPPFAIAFAVLVLVNSGGLVPGGLREASLLVSDWCLATAVAAIGLRTSPAGTLAMGWRALAVPVGATLALMAFVIAVQTMLWS